MVHFGFLCLILCLGSQYVAGSPVSVTEYEPVPGEDAGLRLHMGAATWADAAVRCQLEGGVLASPTTIPIAEAMLDSIAAHRLNSGVFIGISSLLSKGEFRSLDGNNLTDIVLDWASGEPDNAGDAEECLALTGAGALADVSCARVLPYFCRKSARDSNSYDKILRLARTRCHQKGYIWEQFTTSCYWVHRFAKTWKDALAQCHTDGGQLAIINSDTESTVLKNICFKHLDSYQWGIGAQERSSCAIGFRKWEGEWATVDGESLEEAGFSNWFENGSNNRTEIAENCGAISRDGRLNSIQCNERYGFICEMVPYII